MRFAPLSLALLLGLTAPVLAREPLGEDDHIVHSLMSGRVADVIRSECGSISAKMFVVLAKLDELETYARGKGYTEAEVKAFLKDKTEKDRIKAMAADYLAKAGAVAGDEDSYCKVGRDEIAKGSLAGSLLRSWK